MTETERRQIIALVKSEVIPAIGCTEPIAVALCVAKAAEVLNKRPEKITVLLSANILKNAMGVGIPGTGMIGLPIAVALGALIGKSAYQLEVLKDSTPAVSYTHLKEKKNLIATPTGVELIQIIHEELLKSAELTGIWEKKLREIERRTYNACLLYTSGQCQGVGHLE